MKKKKNLSKKCSYIITKPEGKIINYLQDSRVESTIEIKNLEDELKKAIDSLDIPVIYAVISTLLQKCENMIDILTIVLKHNCGLKFLISYLKMDMRSQRIDQASSISILINNLKNIEASKQPAHISLMNQIKKEIRLQEFEMIEQNLNIEFGLKGRKGADQLKFFLNPISLNNSNIYQESIKMYINFLKQKSYILQLLGKELNDNRNYRDKYEEIEKLKGKILSSNSSYSDFYYLISYNFKKDNKMSKEYSTRIKIPESIINLMFAKQKSELDEQTLIQLFSQEPLNLEGCKLEDVILYLLINHKNQVAELALQKLNSPQKVEIYLILEY